MSCGSNPQGLSRPWGFFYLRLARGNNHRWMGLLLGVGVLLMVSIATAISDDEMSNMKRRQQGILTGMPFMANITPRTFMDALGRKLFLAKAPSRVVSMAPNDFRSVLQTITRSAPDEVYNLAGQSSVGLSFEQPVEAIESLSLGTLNLLEAIRFVDRPVRLYNAGSSECFGDTGTAPAWWRRCVGRLRPAVWLSRQSHEGISGRHRLCWLGQRCLPGRNGQPCGVPGHR